MRVGGLADEAGINGFAFGCEPFKHFDRTVDRGAFFIAGDQKADGATHIASSNEAGGSSGERRDRAFHIVCAAPDQNTIVDFTTERIDAPGFGITDRHNIRVPGKTEIGGRRAKTGIKIVNVGRVFVGERKPRADKAKAFEPGLQKVKRTAFERCDTGTADQLLGKADRINQRGGCGILCVHAHRFSALKAKASNRKHKQGCGWRFSRAAAR